MHHMPLLVALLSLFHSDKLTSLLYASLDGLVAYQLISMAKCFTIKAVEPWIVGVLYLVNPLVLLSTISRSSVVFTNLAISTALLSALQDNISVAAIAIAVASYLSFYPLLLLVPMMAVLRSGRLKALVITFLTLAVLLCSSYKVNNDNWDYVRSTYGVLLTFSKIIPNLGLWWYIFIEMFEFFIPFFKAVFNLFVVSFILPFTLRFHKQPFYSFILCLGWITLTKSYPTLGDGGFFLSFIPFFSPLFGYLRYSVVSCLLYTSRCV